MIFNRLVGSALYGARCLIWPGLPAVLVTATSGPYLVRPKGLESGHARSPLPSRSIPTIQVRLVTQGNSALNDLSGNRVHHPTARLRLPMVLRACLRLVRFGSKVKQIARLILPWSMPSVTMPLFAMG